MCEVEDYVGVLVCMNVFVRYKMEREWERSEGKQIKPEGTTVFV